MSQIQNDEIIYENELGYKIAKSSGSLYIILPEEMRYAQSTRALRDESFDTLGIRALNISNAFISPVDLEKIIEGMKVFVDNDAYIRNFIKPYGNMAETNGDSGVIQHIINSDYSVLTKFALVFSTSATCREYTPEIIDQIVAVNGSAEDNPDFNLSTIESYATPFFPLPIHHVKGNKTPAASINNLIAYANYINGVADNSVYTNASQKMSSSQFLSLLFTLGRRGRISRKENIDIEASPDQLSLLRFFSGIRNEEIPQSIINFIIDNNRKENINVENEYMFLTDFEYQNLKENGIQVNSVSLQYILAKYENLQLAIDIDDVLRGSKSTHFFKSNDKTINAIDNYIEETNADIPFEIWLSLNNLRVFSKQIIDVPVRF